MCGGALVTPRIIVSAFHCTKKPDSSEPCDHSDGKRLALLGGHEFAMNDLYSENVKDSKDSKSLQIIPIVEVLHPPNAGLKKDDFQSHDFAMFKLKEPVELAPTVSTICLPGEEDSFAGKKAWAAGWGMTSQGPAMLSPRLMKVELTVSPKVYKHWKMFGTELTQTTGENQTLYKDPCRGDSGDWVYFM